MRRNFSRRLFFLATLGFIAGRAGAQTPPTPVQITQMPALTLTLKKTNIVAGEPVIVCADIQTSITNFWMRTGTVGEQRWLKVDIADASGRLVPSAPYKQMTTKNTMQIAIEWFRPNDALHLEHVVRKSKNALAPGDYKVHVEARLPYGSGSPGADEIAVAIQSAEFTLHVSDYDSNALQKQAEEYYQTATNPAKATLYKKEAQYAVDALFTLPETEARPFWIRLLKNRTPRFYAQSAVWANLMRVANTPGLRNELNALCNSPITNESERTSLHNYLKLLDTYDKVVAGNYPNFQSVSSADITDD